MVTGEEQELVALGFRTVPPLDDFLVAGSKDLLRCNQSDKEQKVCFRSLLDFLS
jgi:hypothetical protein